MRHFTYDRRVNWSECDPGGIIFFPHYARWMVDGLNEMFLSPFALTTLETLPLVRRGSQDIWGQQRIHSRGSTFGPS